MVQQSQVLSLSHKLLGVLKFLFFFKRSRFNKTSVISYVLVFDSLTGFGR